MPIKSFRGLIADGVQDTIVLHTNDGSTGYRIVNFQLFPNTPGATEHEFVVKIYKIAQSTIDGVVDFSNNTLLGSAFLTGASSLIYATNNIVIFDQEIFNQDIYVTCKDMDVGETCNYYIELEQMPLDLNENTVATLKDIRNTA